MTASEAILAKRVANALFPHAEIGRGAQLVLGFGGRAGVNWVRNRMGGLWVGGTATLTAHALSFKPNRMNAALHRDADTLAVTIPLAQITQLEHRFGIATHIIDIHRADDVFSIRCYGAKRFVADIERARAASAEPTPA